MSKFKSKKILCMLLSTAMVATLFTGCGKKEEPTEEITTEVATEEVVETTEDVTSAIYASNGIELIKDIKKTYSSVSEENNEVYNSPMYNLPSDVVFEFECSEEAGYNAYKAFQVYDDPDYENVRNVSYSTNEYENGKIYIKPDGALVLNETGSTHSKDNTWGSLNKLYLVQYIDLQTGEDLDTPIVTPFSIQHSVDAPVISQKLDENNNYYITWDEVPNAVEYRVYEYCGDSFYEIEYTTTDTIANAAEFNSQKKTNDYSELLEQDLINAGYSEDVVDDEGVFIMNKAAKFDDAMNDGYFVVVAIDANGNQSGVSNVVDVRDIANQIPYCVAESVVTKEISSIDQVPAYVNVEMADGSISEMIIDYHGAQAYRYDDNNKMGIKAKVANTNFDSFFIVLTGMSYDDILSQIEVVTAREDELLGKIGSPEQETTALPSAPSNEETQDDQTASNIISDMPEVETPTDEDLEEITEEQPSDQPTISDDTQNTEDNTTETTEETTTEEVVDTTEEDITEEVTEAATEDVTEEATTETTTSDTPQESPSVEGKDPVTLMTAEAEVVNERLNQLNQDAYTKSFYATNDLQAWIAMCLITQQEVITVPVEVFPEAANEDVLVGVFMEAYRQNPTCGAIANLGYSYDYESLVVTYAEDKDQRWEKVIQEYDKAYEISNSVASSLSTDYDKVVALNKYFCDNASYDMDSTSTGAYTTDLSEAFLDAHSPYGILLNNYGVCESYSEAFLLTARIAGLEVLIETGTLDGGGHEWNRVKVDGSWCVLDVTNNDIDSLPNALLNVTETQCAGVLVPDGQSYVCDASATDDSKEYYKCNNMKATSEAEVVEIVTNQLSSSDKAFVRIEGLEMEEIQSALQTVANDLQINFQIGSFAGVYAIITQ